MAANAMPTPAQRGVWVWTAMVMLCLLLPVSGISVLLIIAADPLLRPQAA